LYPSSRQILATLLVLSTEDDCLIACTIGIQRRHCPSQNDDLTADNNCDRAGVHSLIHTTTIARVLLTTPVPRIKVGRAIDAAEIRRILETGPRPRTEKTRKIFSILAVISLVGEISGKTLTLLPP